MKSRDFLAAASTLAVVLCMPAALAQDAKIVPPLAKFGVTFVTSVGELLLEQRTPAPGNPSQAASDIVQLVDRYKSNMRGVEASSNLTKANGELIIATSVVGASSSGVGLVPAVALGALASWGNASFANYLRETGETQAKQMLSSSLQHWDSSYGTTYEDVRSLLQQGKGAEAAAAYDQATGALSFMKDALKDYPAGKETAEKMLFDTMLRNDRATLEEVGRNSEEIDILAARFSKHLAASKQISDNTAAKIDGLGQSVASLKADAEAGSASFSALNQANQKQLAVIGDLLFDQQSPDLKIKLLNDGYKSDLTGAQRSALIKVLKIRKGRDDLIRESASFISDAQNVGSIMHSLGIANPDIDQAISFASAAQSAMTKALQGDYFGAIAGAVGLFGPPTPSPDEQRFNAIMGFLQGMDTKLNTIIDLQQQTLQALNALSRQLSDVQKQLNERLDAIESISLTTSRNLQTLMWQNFEKCAQSYLDRTADGKVNFSDETLNFSSVRDLYKYMNKHSADAISCARSLEGLFSSLKSHDVLGNPLSIRAAVDTDFSVASDEEGKAYKRDDLNNFNTGLYAPAWTVVSKGLQAKWGNRANALAMLASPAATTAGVVDRLKSLDEQSSPASACDETTLLSYRLRSLLCSTSLFGNKVPPTSSTQAVEERAASQFDAFMSDPMLRDQLPTLVRWTLFSARPLDLWSGNGDTYYSPQELKEKGVPRGKDLIWGLLSVLDVAIAQQAMLHGDMMAKFLYDQSWNKNTGEPVSPLNPLLRNSNNPWLVRNVLMFAMADGLSPNLNGDVSVPYQNALDTFTDNGLPEATRSEIGSQLLRELFNFPETADFEFREGRDGYNIGPRLFVIYGPQWIGRENRLSIQLPTPDEFRGRQLVYPPQLYDLIRYRQMAAERLVDYDVLGDQIAASGEAIAQDVLLYGSRLGN